MSPSGVSMAAWPSTPVNGGAIIRDIMWGTHKGSSLHADQGGDPGQVPQQCSKCYAPARSLCTPPVLSQNLATTAGWAWMQLVLCARLLLPVSRVEQRLLSWELVEAWITPLPWLCNTFTLQSLQGIHTPSKRNASGLSAQTSLWLLSIHFVSFHVSSSCVRIVLIETGLISSEVTTLRSSWSPGH